MLLLLMFGLISVLNGQEKMGTCDSEKQDSTLPRIQIRAIFVRCPNQGRFDEVRTSADRFMNYSVSRTHPLLQFYGYDTDEPVLHSEVVKCRQKLVITMKLSSSGSVSDDEFVVIDHVYDPIVKEMARLLNPIVIRMRQSKIKQAFPLTLQHIVNAKAEEEIISKMNTSFKGCSVDLRNPTCGLSLYNNEIIPYSEGFCCSCDAYVNMKRQPESLYVPDLSPVAFATSAGQFPQHLLPSNSRSHSRTHRHAFGPMGKMKLEEDYKPGQALKDIIKAATNSILAYNKLNLELLKRRRSTSLRKKRKDHYRRKQKFSPLLSRMYYTYPPLEPARGFTANDQSRFIGHTNDPWRPINYDSITKKEEKQKQENEKKVKCDTVVGLLQRKKKQVCRKRRMVTVNSTELKDYPPGFDANLSDALVSNRTKEQPMDPIPLANTIYKDTRFPSVNLSITDTNGTRTMETTKKNNFLGPTNSPKLNATGTKDFRAEDVSVLKPHQSKSNKGLNWTYAVDEAFKSKLNTRGDIQKGHNKTEEDLPITEDVKLNITQTVQNSNKRQAQNSSEQMNNGTDPPLETGRKLRKRQIKASGTQVRGGQSCIDRSTPEGVNPETYHDSAHCLRFSDLWYNVYRIKNPFVIHSLSLRLFQKECYESGNVHWEDLSGGVAAEVGTFTRHLSAPSIVISYTPLNDILSSDVVLDPTTTVLLVPRPIDTSVAHLYPQHHGGPGQYLLVRPDDVTFDGEDCNKVGIGYNAFAKQAERCNRPKGTCLDNQPLDLWQHDMKQKKMGVRGKYFLENYADVEEEPLRSNKDYGEFLAVGYDGFYSSIVEIELNADNNILVRKSVFVQISDIYTDSTCAFHTRVTIGVTNTGLASGAFQPRLKNCPSEIPRVWSETEGPLVYIAPQHKHTYLLSLYGSMPVTRFYCSVEIVNAKKELVATRRVRFQKYDRCVCMYHCLCACIGSLGGLTCYPLSLEHYHAAGFQGALPVTTVSATTLNRIVSLQSSFLAKLIPIVFLVHFILLFLGLIKALLGLISPKCRAWGHWMLCPSLAKRLDEYVDPTLEYRCSSVYDKHTNTYTIWYDEEGFPLHPLTMSRTIDIMSPCKAFLFNIIFFLIFPGVAMIRLLCQMLQCFNYLLTGRWPTRRIYVTCPDGNNSVDTFNGYDFEECYSDESSDADFVVRHLKTGLDCMPAAFPVELSKQTSGSTPNTSKSVLPKGKRVLRRQKYVPFSEQTPKRLNEQQKNKLNELVMSFIVYRILHHPIPGLVYSKQVVYSVRGYFDHDNNKYTFTVPMPFQQNWTLEGEKINPPVTLNPKDACITFDRSNFHKSDELSTTPRGVVINKMHFSDEWARGCAHFQSQSLLPSESSPEKSTTCEPSETTRETKCFKASEITQYNVVHSYNSIESRLMTDRVQDFNCKPVPESSDETINQ